MASKPISTVPLSITLGTICLGMILMSLWAAPALGDQTLPIHWNLAGQPDNFASAHDVLVAFPLLGSILACAAIAGSRMAASGGLRPATFAALVIVLGVAAVAEAAIILNGLQGAADLPRPFVAGVAAGVAALGFFLARSARRHSGELTRSTSPSLQRITGWAYVACGLVLLVLTFTLSTTLLPMAIVASTVAPASLAVVLSLAEATRS